MTSGVYRRWAPAERQRRMVALLRKRRSVTIAELEEQFGVSAMTARRDLALLEARGLVSRTWGGATMPSPVSSELPFAERRERDADVKRRIAELALPLIEPHETVLIDGSTTACHLVEQLVAAPLPCTIITNSLAVMELAADAGPQIQLVAIGGLLRASSRSFVGPATIRGLGELYADRAFLSVHGVGPDGAMTDPDPLEAEVKQAFLGQSKEAVLLVQQAKFGAIAQNRIAALADVSHAVGIDLEEDAVALLADAGVQLHRDPAA